MPLALFLLHSQTYVLSTNSDRVPRQPELCTARTWKLHITNVRGSITISIRIGYTIFCVGVWFILHRVHLVYFAPGSGSFCVPSGFFCTRIIPFIYTLNIFIFFFFSYLKKNTLCISHKKKNMIVHYCQN